jgi:hypothetical protein
MRDLHELVQSGTGIDPLKDVREAARGATGVHACALALSYRPAGRGYVTGEALGSPSQENPDA